MIEIIKLNGLSCAISDGGREFARVSPQNFVRASSRVSDNPMSSGVASRVRARVERNRPSVIRGKSKTKRSEHFWATKIRGIFAETKGLFSNA